MSELTTAQEIISDLENEEGLTPPADNTQQEEPTKQNAKEEPVKVEVKEEKPIDEPAVTVITKEFVEKHGLSKHLVGKPIDELGNSYSNMIKQDTKLSQELAQLRGTVEELKAQTTKTVEKAAITETIEELGEMPDPVDDIDGYKAWMKEFKTNLKAEIRADVLKEFGPGLQQVQKQSEDNLVGDTLNLIKEGLPDDADPKEVLSEYIKENKDYFDELISTGRGRTPESLAKEALRDFKAKSFDKNNKLTDEEIVKRASEIAQAQLKKKVKNTKTTDMNTNSREMTGKGMAADIVRDLEAEIE